MKTNKESGNFLNALYQKKKFIDDNQKNVLTEISDLLVKRNLLTMISSDKSKIFKIKNEIESKTKQFIRREIISSNLELRGMETRYRDEENLGIPHPPIENKMFLETINAEIQNLRDIVKVFAENECIDEKEIAYLNAEIEKIINYNPEKGISNIKADEKETDAYIPGKKIYEVIKDFISKLEIDITEKANKKSVTGNKKWKYSQGEILARIEKISGDLVHFNKETALKYIQKYRSELIKSKKDYKIKR